MLIALALVALSAAPAAAAVCPRQARCGTITVPLDHTGVTPGTLPLAYSVLPATGPRAGTIVLLTGGPGEPAVTYTDDVRREFAPLRRAHDIVLVDQRGTGGSGAVRCEYFGYAPECAERLGDQRAFLTTVETARDVDDLRAALGLERITPLGVSYGTKVANEYARRFPERTTSVILDSPVGLDGIDVDGLGAIAAMPRVLREVCVSGPCARAIRDAGALLFDAVRRVRARPVRGPLVTERRGRRTVVETAKIGEQQVYSLLRFSDADPALRAELPAALRSLARGDAAPILHLNDRDRDRVRRPDRDDEEPDEFSAARWHATTCLEGRLPWSPASAPETRDAATRAYLAALGRAPFAPFSPTTVRDRGEAQICALWPATPVPEPAPAAAPDVPLLALSGRADLRTPLEDAQRIASAYPRATVLDVPHVGHSVLTTDPSGCALAATAAFLAGAAPTACAAQPEFAASAYVPASLRGAKTVAAATVEGVRRDLEAARQLFGRRTRYELWGLRGGYTLVTRGRLELRAVEWFRRVRVSGRLSAAGSGRLTLSGAIQGSVQLRRFEAR